MSKWIVNTYTFSPIQGGYFVTQGNLNYTLISGNLTLNAGDTSKVTFVVPKSVADDLYPVRTLVEVKFGNGLNPERKFFGTVVKKTRMVPEGTYRFDAVGVLGSYQFLPNYNNYGADATVGGILSVESQRFRGYYQSGSPYYTPSPWEMLYSGHGEIPSAFGSLVGPYANLKLTCNLESLQKRSKNAYEFLKAITNEQSFVLPEDYVNPPYIFRWFENGETARFGQIAGENEQAITYDTNLISCSLAEEPYYTRVVTYGNSGGTYYYNEQSGNGYPCPFNYARIPLPNKTDGSAYTYVEVQNATNGELKKYPQLIEATAFDRHIIDESVPWLDLSKRVYVFYAPDEYVKAEITQIVYDFADPTKDRVKLGKIVQTATDSIATVSEQIENTVKEYLPLSGGTMTGDLNIINGKKIEYDGKGDLVRLTPHLAQTWSTLITANKDLNTTEFLKVGQYCARTSAIAASLTNCPTDIAFSMTVSAPFGEYDNETTGSYVYRVREITCHDGTLYRQSVASFGSIGVFAYGAWNKVVTTEVEKDTYSNTSVKGGALIARRQGNVVSINSAEDAVAVTANTWVPYVQLGARYRPNETVFVPIANVGTVYSRWVRITTDGWVYLYSTTAVTSASNFGFSTSYIVD